MSKRYRHGQILKLIREQPVYTQDEIANELKKRGVAATQVTLSRDLRELSLVKTQDGYREIARDAPEIGFTDLAIEFVGDVRCAQNLIVLKTDPGHASSVAVALDNEEWPEVVGTISGDDTVLVITADNHTAELLCQKLLKLLA
jgi:transcriptional regulator of arginine metabolism